MFKSRCVLCGSAVGGRISLCIGCREDLPKVEFACKTCAIPLPNDSASSLCGQCVGQKAHVDYSINLFHYAKPVDYLISQMKFQQELSIVAILADLLKTHIENNELTHDLPDVVLPVPLFKKRLTKRGFNQSLELVRPIAKSLNIPVLLDTIERSRDTPAQTNLSKKERKKNVLGSFTLLIKPIHSHIVIVDDVVTTGATTNELAKLLKKSGVNKVGVWSLARAELK